MSQATLKWLRLATPGLIILIFVVIFGRLTDLWSLPWPDNAEKALSSLAVIILGGLYYVTPFRDWANRKYFNRVSENLRSRMLQVSGLSDDPSIYTWKAIRGIFFHFVDSDKSLTAKASLAYFNGFIWTTCADVRVLALLFAGFSAAWWWIGIDGALEAVILFLLMALASIPASMLVTRRHQGIGNEQIEIIELYHRTELRRMLEEVRDRADSSGD